MNTNTTLHAIISKSDQLAIVNALAFYNAFHTFPAHELDADDRQQWRLAFREDNRGSDREGPVDKLANKIANLT